MIYPFLYQILGAFDADTLKKDVVRNEKTYKVWEDWNLEEADSQLIRSYLHANYPHMNIMFDRFFISRGNKSNFHVDRFHYFHLSHRILIPFDDSFHYEWIVNEEVVRMYPKAGQIILFNNMIPHRFVTDVISENVREVVYLDLIHPDLEPFIKKMDGNYSIENGILGKNMPKSFKDEI